MLCHMKAYYLFTQILKSIKISILLKKNNTPIVEGQVGMYWYLMVGRNINVRQERR